MARKGTNCKCPCGCTIWVPPAKGKNSDICRWCEGYTVFGRDIEPKHTGHPDAEVKGGNRPERSPAMTCWCGIPVKMMRQELVHDPKYYLWGDPHAAEVF